MSHREDEYPKALYKGEVDKHGYSDNLESVTVEDPDAEAAARAEGYADLHTLADPLDHDGDGKSGGSRKKSS